jgi:hypothetical protein
MPERSTTSVPHLMADARQAPLGVFLISGGGK